MPFQSSRWIARDKRYSLLGTFVNYDRKKIITFDPGLNVFSSNKDIHHKTILLVIYTWVKLFHNLSLPLSLSLSLSLYVIVAGFEPSILGL